VLVLNDKSRLRFLLATVYRPPGYHTDFIKEFSELVIAADKVLIVGDFNIHDVDNEKDALGLAFKDILKGELRHKMNLWSNKTLVTSQPFSEICFHESRM